MATSVSGGYLIGYGGSFVDYKRFALEEMGELNLGWNAVAVAMRRATIAIRVGENCQLIVFLRESEFSSESGYFVSTAWTKGSLAYLFLV